MTDTDRPRVWGIHAKEEPYILVEDSVIAITWRSQFDFDRALPSGMTREEKVRRFMKRTHKSKLSASLQCRILADCERVKKGDYVAFHDCKWMSEYIFWGRVTGSRWMFAPKDHYEHQRKVKWLGVIKRENLLWGDIINHIASRKAFGEIDPAHARLLLDAEKDALPL